MAKDRTVSREEAQKKATEWDCEYVEVSALNRSGIDGMMYVLWNCGVISNWNQIANEIIFFVYFVLSVDFYIFSIIRDGRPSL